MPAAKTKAMTPGSSIPVPTTNRRLAKMRIDSFDIDPRIQREIIDSNWVKYLAENWDDVSAGVLCASERADGTIVLIDGQNRRLALIEYIGLPGWMVDVEILTGLTLEGEIREFINRNKYRKPVPAYDLYHRELYAGRPEAVMLDRGVTMAGFKIGRSSDLPNTIGAVNTIRTIMRPGLKAGIDMGDVITRALTLLGECMASPAWSQPEAALNADTVGGLIILYRDNPGINTARLRRILTRVTLSVWLDSTRKTMVGSGGELTRAKSFARVVGREYNSRLAPANRLTLPTER